MPNLWRGSVLAAGFLIAAAGASAQTDGAGVLNYGGIKRVLLISIDGMHAVDFLNCSRGISGVNGGQPYCPNLAALAQTGVNYRETSTSKAVRLVPRPDGFGDRGLAAHGRRIL